MVFHNVMMVASLFLAVFVAADDEGPNHVIKIEGMDAYNSAIAEHPLLLMEFYAPWCGHCKQLAPDFERAATVLERESIALAAVDATVEGNAEATIINNIQSYPTLIVFTEGKSAPYEGPRDGLGIIEYMRWAKVGDNSVLLTKEDADGFLERARFGLVGLFNNLDQASAFSTAKSHITPGTVVTASAEPGSVAAKTVVGDSFDGSEAVVLIKPFDEKKVILTGADIHDAQAIVDFVKMHSAPLADRIAPGDKDPPRSWFRKLFWTNEGKLPQIVLCLPSSSEAEIEASAELAAFREALKPLRGRVRGAYSHGDFVEFFKLWAVDQSALPAIVVNMPQTAKRFHTTPDQSASLNEAATITSFIKAALGGSLTPRMKSEPIPAAAYSGAIVEVVYDNFQSVVLDSDYDVVLEVYAPWCGHCRKLAPHWELLAQVFRNEEKLVVASFDGEANDHPLELGVHEGYPKVLYYKAGAQTGIEYSQGPKEFEPLRKWIHHIASFTPVESEPDFMYNTKQFLLAPIPVNFLMIGIFFTFIFVGVSLVLCLMGESRSPAEQEITKLRALLKSREKEISDLKEKKQ